MEHILSAYKTDYDLPSIAGGVIINGQMDVFLSGIRKNGLSERVTENDHYQIGSNSKAMTATMIATIVEDGLISWDSSILEIFPEFRDVIPSCFCSVTLTQLLNHHGGIDPYEEIEDFLAVPQFSGTISQRRYKFTEWVLNTSDTIKIGEYQYSNAGYVIAAAIVEKVTNFNWEELMEIRLLNPLGISAYFDWPAEGGRVGPWGHTFGNNSYIPYNPDSSLQFPEVFNPAGNMSISMNDYLKFIKLHIDGLAGNSGFLNKNVFQTLHNPVNNSSLGWAEITDPETGELKSFHEGNDGTFTAFVIINHTRSKGSAVFTNCSSEKSSEAMIYGCIELMDKAKIE